MILPPANDVVEAGDLRVEVGDIAAIGEEPRNGVHRVGVIADRRARFEWV